MIFHKYGDFKYFDLVQDILVNYSYIIKKDIYVGIEKQLPTYTGICFWNSIYCQTNITDIPNIFIHEIFLEFNEIENLQLVFY